MAAKIRQYTYGEAPFERMLCTGELSDPSNYYSRFQRYRIPLTTLHGGVNSLLLQQLLL